MKYFQHPGTGEVFAYETYEDRARFGDPSLVEMTQAQVAAHLAPTSEALQANFVAAIQRRLDTFAQTHGYYDMSSLATYATSTVPRFSAEAQCGIQLRDVTWAAAFGILAEVQGGTRPMPAALDEIAAELPPMVWAPNIPLLPGTLPTGEQGEASGISRP